MAGGSRATCTACTTSPYEQVEVIQAVPWSGRLAFDGEDPVIPIVRDTRVSSLTCRPMPMHPCDPAGPINTCPTEPSYDCHGSTEQTHELLLLRRRGGAWSEFEPVLPAEVGALLFGPYLLGVEMAAFLLMAGLVGAYHIGRREKKQLHRYLKEEEQ